MELYLRGCLIAVALLVLPLPSDPARILGVFPFENWSHTQFFIPLMKELAARGHQVTVISHLKAQKPVANYTELSLHGLVPILGNVTINRVADISVFEAIIHDILDIGVESCQTILESDIMRRFNQSDAAFDAVIAEIFNTDCFVPFAHRFNAPLIGASSSVPYPWYSDRLGMSNNPAYVSTLFYPLGSDDSLWGRLCNSFYLLATQLIYRVYYQPAAQKIASEFFGPSMPPLTELVKNTSLLLLNSHPSITAARALPPGAVQVAGLNLKAPKKLPQDLEEFISGAEHGVIYFSLGSMLDAASFEPQKKRALIDAFAALPQRVLWRGEDDPQAQNLPPNVKMMRWLPQLDILRHPNTKLFITHGGLFSLIESISAATPVLGMPLFADQFDNMKNAEEVGFGLFLHYTDLTKENILRLITKLLSDSRYAETAKVVSDRFKDRPMSPMDTAIYWVEYVVRHKGASYLKSQAVNLPWYKLYLLDVILFIVCLILATYKTVKLIIKSTLCVASLPPKKQKLM
nr:PREDICTED: UDP-glucuronosyltransferase 2B15-like [Bemisia tabaci]XP_018904600.1 PREDICTED: UDP-glucuronosyltransferase 2B15-like [Bemisia tabaci]